jgi:hypothetical protein
MQKDVRENRAYDSSLRCSSVARHALSIWQHDIGAQPSLHIQQNPPAISESAHCSQHERVVEVIEEPLDIEVENPLGTPAALPRTAHSLVR